MSPKYPHIIVSLTGNDGNAMSILSQCTRTARNHRLDQQEIDAFFAEATSGDYHHLLQTCMRWFTVA